MSMTPQDSRGSTASATSLSPDAARGAAASGSAPGQRRLNGVQRSGRDYRLLSEVRYAIDRTDSAQIPVRDGTLLRADVLLPTDGEPRTAASPDGVVHHDVATVTAPVLVSFSCYPRQVQDLGAPLGFAESGASDFFVPRGYAHVIVNARGTSGSEGTFSLFDKQEHEDAYDVIEWVAAQPWSDGNVGGMGISYFAACQLAAATLRPPHLRAIFPFATMDDLYDVVWPRGVLSDGFFAKWMAAVGVTSGVSDRVWRSEGLRLARRILSTRLVHRQMEHITGDTAAKVLGVIQRARFAEEPFGRLWQEGAVEHPIRDEWWDARSVRPDLARVDIPVYLGCQWDNVPMHLPSTFPVWRGLTGSPCVRMSLFDRDALAWPWESLHEEALAWFDQWLKGRDTGILDGPPIRYVIPGTDRWRTAEQWPPPEASLIPYALRSDGILATDEGEPGCRHYLYLPDGLARPASMPQLPDRLTWQTEPLTRALDIVGDMEVDLDAEITALDTTWIVTLYDVAEDATAVQITAGWLRAAVRTVDEGASRPGTPVLPCRQPLLVPSGETVRYRIPIVPSARRIPAGHRLQLVVASSDTGRDGGAMLGFTHAPAGEASRTTIHSSSRLLLPVLPGDDPQMDRGRKH